MPGHVFIISTHRSGSSLLAKTLYDNLEFEHQNFLGSSEYNIDGHYEDLEYLQISKTALFKGHPDDRYTGNARYNHPAPPSHLFPASRYDRRTASKGRPSFSKEMTCPRRSFL